MLDPEQIIEILRGPLHLPVDEIAVTRLQGDASNRTYYRIVPSSPGLKRSPRTLILMALSEPEAFKASEEKVTGTADVKELPFLNIQRHLARYGIPVPEIYHFDLSRGWLFLEDLGDTTFAQRVLRESEEVRSRYYREAIDTLIAIQEEASRPSDACIAFGRAFDVPLLMWEFDHFLEYEVEKRRGIVLSAGEREEVRGGFSEISEELASEPRCFTHRDYHSRNLMLQPNGTGELIRVIDFQDALMGPPQYDLASLLRDSYIVLEEKTVEDLVEYYLERKGPAMGKPDPARFRERFDLMSLQRNLKAAGRFAYIALVKKNPRYLDYIPQTLKRVGRNLEKYPRLLPLRRILGSRIEELRSP
jgi:aminoglycoside/choline kinase family phosphotransferase